MRKFLSGIYLLLLFAGAVKAQAVAPDWGKIPAHPRLLLLKGEEESLRALVKTDASWKKVHDEIIRECDSILQKYPLKRDMIGRRLLQVSREGIRRIFFLSYAARTTGKKKYASRCEEELLAVCNFRDWNPDHFLDVAEMTLAVSIGYDWLYNDLPEKSKAVIKKAIIEKGLLPSQNSKYNGWLRGNNNWNQVCNAGITYGALAVYEEQPQVSQELLLRALTSIEKPMAEYAPAGNYKEGYSYWGYGTSFNVFFISALEKIFGTDFGLAEKPGFMESAAFYQHLISQSGLPFNYSDAGGLEGLQPAMFWFANRQKDPSLLYIEKQYLQESKFNARTNRLLPAALIWANGISADNITLPKVKTWSGKSDNQVVMMRSGWQKNQGIYVGFKGGTPSVSHGHMDAGSFVMDANGVRWSADLGMQQYNSLESAGLSIWDMSQHSERWQVFRYTNYAHSTLTVNNHLQQVKADAPLIKFSDDSLNMRAVLDLSAAYAGDLTRAQRGIAIANGQYVNVRDELQAGDSICVIRWAMLTPATVSLVDGNQAQLTSKGQKMILSVIGLPDVKLTTWRTDPPRSYDAVNPGTTLIGFEVTVPANTKLAYNVMLVPGEGITIRRSDLKSLDQW
jgi:hypothetical protein